MRSTVWALIGWIAVACGGPTPPPRGANAASEVEPDFEEPEEVSPAEAQVEAEELPEIQVRVVLDLVRHPELASMWHGNTEVVSLGGLDGARHTLGGWATQTERVRLEDEQVLVSRSRQARIPFSWIASDLPVSGVKLRLSARATRRGVSRFFLGGEPIGEATLPTTGWQQVELDLPEGLLQRGENRLMVRTPGSASRSGGRVGLIARTMTVGPADETPPEAPQPFRDGEIRLDGDWRIRVPIRVPEESRLVGEVEGTVSAKALGDGFEIDLGTHTAGPLNVDLGSLAGRLAYLELSARSSGSHVASASIRNPVIVRPRTEEDAEIPTPKNVVLILVDTLRADRLSPYNPETRVQTPALAAFAQNSTTFTHAHAQENWTKPSVATLLSGLMPWEHTATGQGSVVPRSVELLPEVLGERGFVTASFICNGYVSDRFGFRQGWDTYRNYIREGRRTRAENVAADVLTWLDGRAEGPFFLYVHTIDPHVPYRPPRRYVELYGDPEYRGPVDFRRDSMLLENIKLGHIRLNRRDRAHLEALYDGEISYHDQHFRSILDGLERRGIDDETMVILTSDHGEEFWDHGSVGHGHSVYEELLHVPLFVRMPGASTSRIEASVGLVDVMPTILEALGQPIPAGVSGRSFLAELRGGGGTAPRASVSGFMDNWRTVTDDRYKMIVRPRRAARLFDLESDPSEQNDIAAERPFTLRYLREAMALRLDASRPSQSRTSQSRTRRHRPRRTTIDAETAAQLRALGYVVD